MLSVECSKIHGRGVSKIHQINHCVTGTALISIWLVLAITAVPTIREFESSHCCDEFAVACWSWFPAPPPPPPTPPKELLVWAVCVAPLFASTFPVNTTFCFKV